MTAEVHPPAATRGALRTAVDDVRFALTTVFRNRNLRRVQIAFAGSTIGDWAYSTATAVWLYGIGGAKAVGIFGAVRLLIMSVVAPFAATLSDRVSRKALLIGSDVVRAFLLVAATLCLFAGTPPWPIYVLVVLGGLVGCIFRPSLAAILPSLVDHPEELTASNGVASTMESLAFFVGPAIGAFLVHLTNIETVFLVNALSFLLSAALLLGLRPHPEPAAPPEDDAGGERGALAEMFAGLSTIRSDRDLTMVFFLVTVQTLVAGALGVLAVVFAVELLGSGPSGVGYFNSVFGIGALAGGFLALARATRNRLSSDLAVGVLLWSVPLLLVAAWPSPVTAFAACILMGFGNPLVDVNFATLLQRIVSDRVLGRVFGAFEGGLIATMAIGSAVTPFLLDHLGLRTTLIFYAALVGLITLAYLPRCRRLDARLLPPEGLDLLRAIPMFAVLTPATLESLARKLGREDVGAGIPVVSEGEDSDRFLIIESGSVEVAQAGRRLRVETAGDYFGEIGLLRDVPRTATVTALEPTSLRVVLRQDFLDAVTGSEESRFAADDIVRVRLLG